MPAPRRIRSNTVRPEDAPSSGPRVVAPEAVDPRGPEAWQVRLSRTSPQGGTNHRDRRMFAPAGPERAAAHVRLHELMHARITPPTLLLDGHVAGRSQDALQACEDARIGETGRRTPGLELLAQSAASVEEVSATLAAIIQAAEGAAKLPPAIGAELAARSWHGAACLTACLWRTDRWQAAWSTLRARAPSHVGALTRQAVCLVRDRWRDPAVVLEAAELLDRILVPPPGKPGAGDGTDWPEGEREDIPEGEDAASWDAAADQVRRFEAPLTLRLSNPSRARRRTADLGRLSHPSDVLRMEAGRPFSRRRKIQGAVILLDSSGSMHYGHDDLAAIVAGAPGALVAIHASKADDESGRQVGTFAIVGQGGRCIAPDDLAQLRSEVGGGNANDGGCLQLMARLARQHRIPGPRYWVTDQGFGDSYGHVGGGNVVEACNRLATRHGFEIVAHESEVFA